MRIIHSKFELLCHTFILKTICLALLIVAGSVAPILLQGCSGELSDNELAMGAMLRADSLISNGYCPTKQRDSLAIEMTILLFWRGNRADGLIRIMKESPGFESNSEALYGLAIGYAMKGDTAKTRHFLEQSVSEGDWHLYMEDELAKFQILGDDLIFPELVQKSEANYDFMMANASQNALQARKRRAAVEEDYRGTIR